MISGDILVFIIPLVTSIFWHAAAAADLRMVPRFPGSLMLSQIRLTGRCSVEVWSRFRFSYLGLWNTPMNGIQTAE